MNLIDQTINLIESNRISSTEVADALGKTGALSGLKPVNPGLHISGKIHYVYCYDETNWPIHEQIQTAPEKCVLMVDAFNCAEKAIFGDLVGKYLMLYKRVSGVVVNGNLRDIPDLRKYNYPIWCTGYSPIGCYNRPAIPTKEVLNQAAEKAGKYNNGIMVCDDSGCTAIESCLVNNDTYSKLEMIELQEDIWGYCINTLKWSTYDTVCLKKYLINPEVLPEVLRDRVKSIPFRQ